MLETWITATLWCWTLHGKALVQDITATLIPLTISCLIANSILRAWPRQPNQQQARKKRQVPPECSLECSTEGTPKCKEESQVLACVTDAVEAISSWRESWWPCIHNVAVSLCPTVPDWCGNCIISNNTCCMHKHLWVQVYSLILLAPC